MYLAGYSLIAALASNRNYLEAFDLYEGMGQGRIADINKYWREIYVNEKIFLIEKEPH